jgi:hypothetical protein
MARKERTEAGRHLEYAGFILNRISDREETDARIDRVHQPGHVGCHEGYSFASYPDNSPVLGGSMHLHAMNSQVCEQGHSSLEAISTQAKFMRQDHFLQYVRYFLYRHNMTKIRNLDES